jgi:hypothetical protein
MTDGCIHEVIYVNTNVEVAINAAAGDRQILNLGQDPVRRQLLTVEKPHC